MPKEAIVFDLAIDKLCGYWSNRTYDIHLVHAHKVRCLEPEVKYKASEQKVRESDQLKETCKLHKFLCNHVVWTTYNCLFGKCTN